MSDPDMDAPVTRRQLHDALEIWGGVLTRNIALDVITQVKALLKVLEDKLMTELRGQVHGNSDRFDERLSVIDDKYKDLPGRVSKLEAKVFPSSPKRNRRRAR